MRLHAQLRVPTQACCLTLACVLAACGSKAQGAPQTNSDAGGFGNSTGNAGTFAMHDAGILYATLADRPCPADDALSYESFGATFFATYCEPCHSSRNTGDARHGAPPGVTFDDLTSIRAGRTAIWNMAGDQNARMPPVGLKPSMSARMQLGAWLACGAPSTSDNNDAGTP
jgi:hypothetical protein